MSEIDGLKTALTQIRDIAVLALGNVVNVTLPTDGSDVAVTLQEQVAAAPPGSIVLLPEGTFVLHGYPSYETPPTRPTSLWRDAAPKWTGLQNIMIQGGPTTFVADELAPYNDRGRTNRPHLVFQGCDGLTVRDVRVESQNTINPDTGFSHYDSTRAAEHGLTLNECSNVLIERFSCQGVFGDGVYIGNQIGGDNITLRDIDIESNGRQGIGITNGRNILIENFRIGNSGRGGVDIEPNIDTAVVNHVTIRHGSINNKLFAFPMHGAGDVSWVTIEDVDVLSGSVIIDVRGAVRHDFVLDGIRNPGPLRGSPRSAFEFRRQTNVTIRNCVARFKASRPQTAVKFQEVEGTMLVADNCFDGAAQAVKYQIYDGGWVDAPYPGTETNNVLTVGCAT